MPITAVQDLQTSWRPDTCMLVVQNLLLYSLTGPFRSKIDGNIRMLLTCSSSPGVRSSCVACAFVVPSHPKVDTKHRQILKLLVHYASDEGQILNLVSSCIGD